MSGFRFGLSGGTGREAHRAFLAALESAPEGANFEVGLTWTVEHKWRVYQRIGNTVLMMSSDEARHLYRTYEKHARKPEFRQGAEQTRPLWTQLKSLASEAFHKNQRGEVPPDSVQFMPSEGRA